MNYGYRAILLYIFERNCRALAQFKDCILDHFGYKDVNGLVAIKQDIEADALLIWKAQCKCHNIAGNSVFWMSVG